MVCLLVLLATQAADFPEAEFFRTSAPALSKMIVGSSPLLESRRMTVGVEANLCRFRLLPNPVMNSMPLFSAYYCYAFHNDFGSYVFLRGGVYPQNGYTLNSPAVFSAGFGISPNPVKPLSARLAYGTLGKVQFYPGDPYDNYVISQLHSLNLDVSASHALWRLTGQAAVGGSLTLVTGEYRKDIGGIDQPYSSVAPGWWADAALKFWWFKLSGGVANGVLSAGLGLQLGL